MFQIVNQSYVSEHIPRKVKELATDNMSVNAKYVAPLIAEGQRLGEITEGDPMQMGIAYFSMIQGLGLIKAQSWESFSIPEVPVIMKLFGKNTGLPEARHGNDKRAKLLPLVLPDSESTYRTKLPFSDQFVMEDASIVNLREGDSIVVRITVNDRERKIRRVAFAESGSMKPRRAEVYSGNKMKKRVEYTDGSVMFTRFENKSKRRFGLGEIYYDAYTLFQLLMSYPFGSGAMICFTLVLDGNLPIPIGPMDLYVKETGIETVQVPGGKFECFRLEMGLSGALGIMAEISKSHFWYSVESPHWPVKFENKSEDTFTEFVSVN